MGELKSIEGTRKKKQEPLCLHCNMVPHSKHPGLTCPRIESVTLDENWQVYSIHYMNPRDWAVLLLELRQEETQ